MFSSLVLIVVTILQLILSSCTGAVNFDVWKKDGLRSLRASTAWLKEVERLLQDDSTDIDEDKDKGQYDYESQFNATTDTSAPSSPSTLPPKPKPKPKPHPIPARPIRSDTVYESKIYALDGQAYQEFGNVVATNGLYVAASATSTVQDTAKVYVFAITPNDEENSTAIESGDQTSESSALGWKQLQTIQPKIKSSYDGFGESIVMSDKFLIVGSPYDDEDGYLSGKVYLYDYTGDSTSSSSNSVYTVHSVPYLTSPARYRSGAHFGAALALQGNTLAIGSPGDSSVSMFQGAVFLYHYDTSIKEWQYDYTISSSSDHGASPYDRFGSEIVLLSNSIVISAVGFSDDVTNGGAVYIYEKVNTTDTNTKPWKLAAFLAPTDVTTNARFGYSIAFTEDYGLVSAFTSDYHSGVVYVYQKSSEWSLVQKLYPSGSNSGGSNYFGSAVSLHTTKVTLPVTKDDNVIDTVTIAKTIAVVGASGDATLAQGSGAVYLYGNPTAKIAYDRSTGLYVATEQQKKWQQIAKFTANDSTTDAGYGSSIVNNQDSFLFVGANSATTPIAKYAGAIYLEANVVPYFVTEVVIEYNDEGNGNGDNYWDTLKRSFSSKTGIVMGAIFLPAIIVTVCVLLHVQQSRLQKEGVAKSDFSYRDYLNFAHISNIKSYWNSHMSYIQTAGADSDTITTKTNIPSAEDAIEAPPTSPLVITDQIFNSEKSYSSLNGGATPTENPMKMRSNSKDTEVISDYRLLAFPDPQISTQNYSVRSPITHVNKNSAMYPSPHQNLMQANVQSYRVLPVVSMGNDKVHSKETSQRDARSASIDTMYDPTLVMESPAGKTFSSISLDQIKEPQPKVSLASQQHKHSSFSRMFDRFHFSFSNGWEALRDSDDNPGIEQTTRRSVISDLTTDSSFPESIGNSNMATRPTSHSISSTISTVSASQKKQTNEVPDHSEESNAKKPSSVLFSKGVGGEVLLQI